MENERYKSLPLMVPIRVYMIYEMFLVELIQLIWMVTLMRGQMSYYIK